MTSDRPNPLCHLCRMVELAEKYLRTPDHAEELIKSLNGLIILAACQLPPAIEPNLFIFDEVTTSMRQVKDTADFIRDLRELLFLKQV